MQKEAILNECKGNLFEFLVAQGLAKLSGLEDHFLLNLDSDFKNKLKSYEDLIRSHDGQLLQSLPELSKLTVKTIWNDASLAKFTFLEWRVIGKLMSTTDNKFWNETDIVGVIKTKEEATKHMVFSLKLSKDHSYTNTKSAGVKSFLVKYFSFFGNVVTELQAELNKVVDESFLIMGHRLYSHIDREFTGCFNSDWTQKYTELPGELSPEMKTIVHQNYHRVALKLSELLNELKELDNDKFYQSLAALCGFSHSEIIQVTCFHHENNFKNISIKNSFEFFSSYQNNYQILPLKELASSIEISIGKVSLQLRVKPMNKFTTPAYKINCSIKVKK